MAEEVSIWYEKAKLDPSRNAQCTYNTRCSHAEPNGNCDNCDTIDGRWMGAVCEYASTCDGGCMELTHRYHLTMDPYTQLGYCDDCIPKQKADLRKRLEAVKNDTWEGPAY